MFEDRYKGDDCSQDARIHHLVLDAAHLVHRGYGCQQIQGRLYETATNHYKIYIQYCTNEQTDMNLGAMVSLLSLFVEIDCLAEWPGSCGQFLLLPQTSTSAIRILDMALSLQPAKGRGLYFHNLTVA